MYLNINVYFNIVLMQLRLRKCIVKYAYNKPEIYIKRRCAWFVLKPEFYKPQLLGENHDKQTHMLVAHVFYINTIYS